MHSNVQGFFCPQVCRGSYFPSSPCISTVRVSRLHWPGLCGQHRLLLSVWCAQPRSARDMWRVYPSPQGWFTSLNFPLNLQVIAGPLLPNLKLSELPALPVPLFLRSPFNLTPLQMKRDHSGCDKTPLGFPSLPWWSHQTAGLRGMGTAPGKNTNSVVFTNKHVAVCLCVFNQFPEGWNGCFWQFWPSFIDAFLEKVFIKLFLFSCWKFPSGRKVFIVCFPRLVMWCLGRLELWAERFLIWTLPLTSPCPLPHFFSRQAMGVDKVMPFWRC